MRRIEPRRGHVQEKDMLHTLHRIEEHLDPEKQSRRAKREAFRLGLLKGLGTAIGFTVLGAAVVYFLQLLVRVNLPYITDFIVRIIEIIESKP